MHDLRATLAMLWALSLCGACGASGRDSAVEQGVAGMAGTGTSLVGGSPSSSPALQPTLNLGPAPSADPTPPAVGGSACGPNLTAVIRDFNPSHPDFQSYSGGGITERLVQDQLGADGAPVFRSSKGHPVAFPPSLDGDAVQITSAESFAQWYSVAHPTDKTFLLNLDTNQLTSMAGTPQTSTPTLTKSTDAQGNIVYASELFFPIDQVPNAGDLQDGEDGKPHNFLFTFELNTTFVYKGGEVWTFLGDDDLWAFIDSKLVADVGGLHTPETRTVQLDSLGLTRGQTYKMAVFQAERHSPGSHFKMTTSIQFSNCDPIVRRPVK